MQVEKIDTFSGHKGAVYALEGGISKEIFYSGAADGMLVQWNLQKPDVGKGIAQFQKGIFSIKYVPQTHQLWVATHLEGIHVIDLQSNQEVFSFAELHDSFFTFELLGDAIYVGNSGGKVLVFDVFSKKLVHTFHGGSFGIRKLLSISNDKLLIGSTDGSLRMVNQQGATLHSQDGHQKTVFSFDYNPKTKSLFSVGKDAKVKHWTFRSNLFDLQEELVGHIFPIHDITFNSNKNLFATASMDKTLKIWDASEFKLLKVIDFARHGGHKNSVNKLYWSDYQDLLVSASDDKKISVWKLNS